MASLASSPFVWFLFILLVAAGAMALWAFYYWWKRDRHTRERFAFSGFFALLGFGTFFLGSLSLNTSMVGGLLFALLKPLGLTAQTAPPALSPMETWLFAVIFSGLIYAYIRVFTAWTGQKSRAQHQQEQNREAASVLRDIKLQLSRRPEDREKRAPYREAVESNPDLLERPQALVWHERARQLWRLRNRGYVFDGEYDLAHSCWVRPNKGTKCDIAVLALAWCDWLSAFWGLPNFRVFQAADFRGRIPRESLSFSSEKSYSPSILICAHDMGE